MDDENRKQDKKHFYYPESSRYGISKDVIKSKYIADGLSAEDIAKETRLPLKTIEEVIDNEKLSELRKAYVVQGIQKIQNTQIQQANKLMDLENNFKRMRIIQLEKALENYLAYYSRHGDFLSRHPVTGDILKDLDGIPMQIRIPNISKELIQLKESVTISEGMRSMLHRLDEIINTRKEDVVDDENVIDVDYKEIFGEE